MIRFALVFALVVAAAQATEVNLRRGAERRLDDYIVTCQGVTVGTKSGKIIGPSPNRENNGNPADRPQHTPESCRKFCFETVGHAMAHYHPSEHPGVGDAMHCRCHPANLPLVCTEADGAAVYVNKNHRDVSDDFQCPTSSC